MAFAIAASVVARLGVGKAAGAGVYLDDLAAQFMPLTEEYVQVRRQVRQARKQVRQLGKQVTGLHASTQPAAARHGFVALHANEWRAELVRRLAPKPVNGYHFNSDMRGTDGTGPPPGHPG
jgi:hypothetical protein